MLSLNIILALATLGLIYFFWLRPILKETPALKDLFGREETFFSALEAKFAGIKQRLTGALIGGAVILTQTYDTIIPQVTGIDTTPLLSHFPAWVTDFWPYITIAGILLMNYFRKLADKAHAAELEAVQALQPASPVIPSEVPVVAAPVAPPAPAVSVAASVGVAAVAAAVAPQAAPVPPPPPPGTL